jgi:cytochrome c-type biogenesis protein CcmH
MTGDGVMMPYRHRPWRLVVAGAVVLGVALLSAVNVNGLERPSFEELEESLTCQCGCGLTVHSCNHLQCDSAMPLRAEIRAQMDTGKDKNGILAYFSDKYGEKILSAPTTSGFNVLAWVTPFILLLIGGAVVGITVMRWTARRRATPEAAASPPTPHAPSQYDKILEKELKNFDG